MQVIINVVVVQPVLFAKFVNDHFLVSLFYHLYEKWFLLTICPANKMVLSSFFALVVVVGEQKVIKMLFKTSKHLNVDEISVLITQLSSSIEEQISVGHCNVKTKIYFAILFYANHSFDRVRVRL